MCFGESMTIQCCRVMAMYIAITVTVVLLQLCLETLVPSDHCIAYRVVDVQILASVLDLTN